MTMINIKEVIAANDDLKKNIKTMSSVILDLSREIKKQDTVSDSTDMIRHQIQKLRNTRDNMKKLSMALDSVLRLYNKTESKAMQLIDGFPMQKTGSYDVSMNDLTTVGEVSAPYRIV